MLQALYSPEFWHLFTFLFCITYMVIDFYMPKAR